MKNKLNILLMIASGVLWACSGLGGTVVKDTSAPATVSLVFQNEVKASPVVLRDSSYVNPFGEQYTISKLRYYVSHITLVSESGSYTFAKHYLVDQADDESQTIKFDAPEGVYKSMHFLLGVDSLHNVSGAQTGALDPTKDMFWTWNTGYVMLKMEGNSPASTLFNQKYEFHTGGFSGPWSVLQNIQLNFEEPVLFTPTGGTQFFISADINKLWKGNHSIKIADDANITAPGKLAQSLSENYARMFSLKKIVSAK